MNSQQEGIVGVADRRADFRRRHDGDLMIAICEGSRNPLRGEGATSSRN